MRKTYAVPFLAFVSALVFTALFYRQSIGLNLLLFEAFLVCIVFFLQKEKLKSSLALFSILATMLTAISFVVQFTTFALITNLISFLIFIGVLVYQDSRSLITTIKLSVSNMALSVRNFFGKLGDIRTGEGRSIRSLSYKFKILLIPILIVVLFLGMYNQSSPYFNEAYTATMGRISDILNQVDLSLVMIFSLGLYISIFSLARTAMPDTILLDTQSSLLLSRVRKYTLPSKAYSLKKELIAAKFLLIILNVLILIVNILDIQHVWFNFEWNGSYLKQFVHEGTYLLIISIFISISIALYFFRGNMNFYTKSSMLKNLTVAWMIQNAVLVMSVAVRNFHYISYFALAYKRIGVIFFLLLTLYGVYTVITKIRNKHSAFYLFRNNSMAVFVVMIVISMVNWDNYIARYNFNHYKTAFIHYDFLSGLPAKCLPYLDKTESELAIIDQYQQKLFRFDMKYMNSEEYLNEIQKKKDLFMKTWKSKGLLSWNYVEYKAYNKLPMIP